MRLLIAIPAIALASGCGILSPDRTLAVLFPGADAVEAGFPEPDAWEISWLSEEGVSRRRVDGADRIALRIPKERPLVVAARPVTDGISPLWSVRPAGAVYAAYEPPPDEVPLTWEEGFSAWYLLRAAEAGIDPEAVNLVRFTEAVRTRGEDRPWDLDLETLGEALAGGTLRIYSFRLSPLVAAEIPLPEGVWYSEYALDAPLAAGSEGWAGDLGAGIRDFLRVTDGMAATVSLDEDGSVAMALKGP